MVVFPVAKPVAWPVDKPMEAIVGSLLVHVPPALALVKVVAKPRHIDGLPVMGLTGVTVTTSTALSLVQPNALL